MNDENLNRAKALKQQIQILSQSKQEIQHIKAELETEKKHELRLVYLYEETAKSLNITHNPSVSDSLLAQILTQLDADLKDLESQYQNLCK